MSIFQPLDIATICSLTVGPAVSLGVTCNGVTTNIIRGGVSMQRKAAGGGIPKHEPGWSVYNLLRQLALAWHEDVDQDEWISYQASVAGTWDLCADNTGLPVSQNFFHQYNLFRWLQRLDPVLQPVDPGEVCPFATAEVIHVRNDFLGIDYVQYNGLPVDIFFVGKKGRGLLNPTIVIPHSTDEPVHYLPGTPEFANGVAWIAEWIPADAVGSIVAAAPGCISTLNGAPGRNLGSAVGIEIS